ncbi:unnamed protein product [Lactuca saligna]|uniref:Extra-large guanine nucleotide-binding protein 1 n=1 Tax=Lactuca saligna TaxID=75948 RepID=A0AA36A6C0_LACSI|nr:unnamed protein product [Lactuca saligna]
MGSILRSILPIRSSKQDEDDDEFNPEYSFAMEYTGPPVSYDIPRAVPVDVAYIPTASVVSTPFTSGNLSLPVIHPVIKREPKSISSEIKDTTLVSGLIVPDTPPEGEGSSASLGFSDSQENSQEFSMSSEGDGLDNYCHEIVELYSSSQQDENQNESHDEISSYDNRTQVVTFGEPESISMVESETDYSQSQTGVVVQERRHASSQVKKGLCHRCLKGNRFTSKEFCIVCDAKYCSKCVLRVMGSMPEGRKCISCIGYPIDESNRGHIGKCSKVLKQLLTDFQIKQVMGFEEACQINQLPYWLVIVNGKPLSLEEVVQLRSCPYPPQRLRPGSYWYDKLSGYWGKEGHKPSQIITPQLSLGGSIMENASNGNTRVKINNRVITKTELKMLKFVGINYKDCTDFWLGPDGSVLEEGQKQVKGNMWEKPGIKVVCGVLSLPMPPKSFMSSEEETVNNGSKIMQKNIDIKPLTKILLVGQDQSGTSAIYKQAKILYKIPFLENEREELKSLIQRNLYLYISILLEGLIKFEEEYSIQIRNKLVDQPSTSAAGAMMENIYSLSTKLKIFSDWLLEIVKSGNLGTVFPAATREYSGVVEELWKDKAFQAAYARRSEVGAFPIVADYFLPRAVEISSANYEPSDVDILYADGISSSNGLTSMEFSVPSSFTNTYMEVTDHNHPPLQRYELIRVNSSNLGDNCKWLSMFEDVDLILYCVDLTSYDDFYIDNNLILKNKMLESKSLFKTMVTHPRFKDKAFLLILNKFDLLENKIKTRPLTECEWFHDFNPFISNHTNNNSNSNNNNDSCVAQYGFQYVAAKFKRLFGELTGRKLYVTSVTGLEADSVDGALRYGGEVLRWVDEENKPKSSNNEWSSESVETSS